MGNGVTILVRLLGALLGGISEPLRALIADSLDKWERKAAETTSPVDDVVVQFLKALFAS